MPVIDNYLLDLFINTYYIIGMDTDILLEWHRRMEDGIDKIWNVSEERMPDFSYSIVGTRKEVISLSEGCCECCGGKGEHIHHRDRDRSNNKYINLIYLISKKCYQKNNNWNRKNNYIIYKLILSS